MSPETGEAFTKFYNKISDRVLKEKKAEKKLKKESKALYTTPIVVFKVCKGMGNFLHEPLVSSYHE